MILSSLLRGSAVKKNSRTFIRGTARSEDFSIINPMITEFQQFKLDRIFQEISQDLNDLSLQQVGTIQGILNGLVYSAALNDGVAYRDSNNKLQFDFRHIGYFFRGDRAVHTPITFLTEYLKKYWAGLTYYSRDLVARTRRMMCEKFKIFTQEDRTADWRDPKNRHRNPNPCGEFNMLRALLLARACEEHLLCYGRQLEATQLNIETAGNGSYEWERIEDKSFPKHKGYTLAAIGKAAGIWTGSETSHPDIVGAIELEYLRLKAEEQLRETEPGDRTEEEILEQELVAVTETEVVESEGVAVIAERVIDAVPLAILVRRSMLVAARRLLSKADDGGVVVPNWALGVGDRARLWWKYAISEHSWLVNIAPDWVSEVATVNLAH